MKGLKPILPSLREKKRYLAFEILSKSKIKAFSEVSKAIWLQTLSFSGEKGVARAGIWVLPEKYNPETQRGLIRVSHNGVDELKASLALIRRIENQPVVVRSLGASGILRKAEQRYIAA
jgi:ribonuclease P/MRP protein subunit POP5